MEFASVPILRHLVVFCIGSLLYRYTAYYSPLLIHALIGMAVAAALLARMPWQLMRGVSVLMCFFLLGWILTHHHTPRTKTDHFIHQANILAYQATVISQPERKPKTYKTEANVTHIRTPAGWQKATGRVLLYLPHDLPKKPIYGDTYALIGKPREVEPPKNPLEFNYKTFLSNKGIYAHHFVRPNEFVYIGNNPANRIQATALRLRAYADSTIRHYLPSADDYPITNAMLLGLRDEIDHDVQKAYSDTGAVHILSVSGMHVAFIYALLQFLFGKGEFWQRFGRHSRKPSYIFSVAVILILAAYALLTGLSPSVVRATLMFSLIQVATLLNRPNTTINTLAVSALLLLSFNPYWLTDVGFQLSYLAVLGIYWVLPLLHEQTHTYPPVVKAIATAIAISFAAQLFTFPVSVFYFHQFPNYFLLTNLFVGIGSSLIIYVGLAILFFSSFLPLIAQGLSKILSSIIYGMNEAIFFIQDLPKSVATGYHLSWWEVLLLYIGIGGMILFFQQRRLAYLFASFVAALTLFSYNIYIDLQQQQNQEITFHFIPKQSAITLVAGKQAVLIGDTSLTKDPRTYDFHFKNYYDSLGITKLKRHIVSNTEAVLHIQTKQTPIVWVRQKPTHPISTDSSSYVLVSKNAIRNLQIFKHPPKLLIIDNSNSRYTTEKLLAEAAEAQWPAISLYDEGSIAIRNHD